MFAFRGGTELCQHPHEKIPRTLAFEADSQLVRIAQDSFTARLGLGLIHSPASVEFSGQKCLAQCSRLARVTFERGLQLARLEDAVSRDCSALNVRGTIAKFDCHPERIISRQSRSLRQPNSFHRPLSRNAMPFRL
jgi:hypothetical protein